MLPDQQSTVYDLGVWGTWGMLQGYVAFLLHPQSANYNLKMLISLFPGADFQVPYYLKVKIDGTDTI